MVVISLTTCLIVLHSLGSVGIGTVMAAVLVGVVLGRITHFWKRYKRKQQKRKAYNQKNLEN
jgi:uncharacterized membrane protein YczE